MAAALLFAWGCGDGDSAERLGLRIQVEPPGRRVQVWHLRCDPPGGTWPQADAACRRLDAEMLGPIGPETRDLVAVAPAPVLVTGTAFGRPVRLFFGVRGSSTRRDRFELLRQALGLQLR